MTLDQRRTVPNSPPDDVNRHRLRMTYSLAVFALVILFPDACFYFVLVGWFTAGIVLGSDALSRFFSPSLLEDLETTEKNPTGKRLT